MKLKSALAAAAVAGIDDLINAVPDPALRIQLRAFSFTVKVPYAFLKELLPDETDQFVKEVLNSDEITEKVINSPAFQQALGNTLQSMVYAKESEKREIIKKAFTGAFIGQDEYARSRMERLQDTANRITISSLQHLTFIKSKILPIMDKELENEVDRSKQPPGYTTDEYRALKRRTTPISKYYDSWYKEQRMAAEKEFNRNRSAESKANFDLAGAREQKWKIKFREFWTEFGTLGIFQQGNDPTTGTIGGGGGTVQYLTEFGEKFIEYVDTSTKLT